jgi:allantoinase
MQRLWIQAMPAVDLLVKNGRLILKEQIQQTDLVIDDGKIVEIGHSKPGLRADRTIDAEGNLILPGCIDIHVHSREPHGVHTAAGQEDFQSLSQAAAAGGYTSLFDMPVTGEPPTTTVEGFRIKKDIAEKRCLVDYAFYGGAGFGNLEEIEALADAGVIGFKIFTREVPQGKDWRGVVVGEGGSEMFLERLKARGEVNLAAYYRSAPNASEFLEISRSIGFARSVGGKINIAHLSTAEGLSMVREAKAVGMRVYAETCPHYLLLTNRDLVERLGPYGKMYPPLRSDHDQEELWRGLNDGAIDFIATDHAPHPKETKESGWDNIFEATAGVPGLETALPLMMTAASEGRINLFRLVEAMAERPAEAFGISRLKGALKAGCDGDFVIVDPKRETTLRENTMFTRSSAKVFDGRRVRGVPILTAVRGEVVMEEGDVSGKPGYGKYVFAKGEKS